MLPFGSQLAEPHHERYIRIFKGQRPEETEPRGHDHGKSPKGGWRVFSYVAPLHRAVVKYFVVAAQRNIAALQPPEKQGQKG